MTYEEWQAWVPAVVRGSSRWKQPAYRLSLFLTELAWADIRMLMRHRRTRRLAEELYAALCAMSDALALSFARASFGAPSDLYASVLQSARCSQDCYARARYVIGARAARHRLRLLARIIRLLPTTSNFGPTRGADPGQVWYAALQRRGPFDTRRG